MATGLLGGTFDPVHIAHLIAAEAALEDLELDRVIFMPCAAPPHKPDRAVTPVGSRLEMCRLAVAGNAGLVVSDMEAERPSPSYTIDTVRSLRGELGASERLVFVMGADSLAQFFTWKEPLELLSSCEFAVAPRPGVDLADADPRIRDRAIVLRAPMVDVSSSDIRRRVREGRSIRYLVPPEVSAYIAREKLYS